jgi:hypothetical protein
MENRRPAFVRSIQQLEENFNYHIVKPVINADSPEVVTMYYTDKKQALEASLAQLTLENNAKEIAEICAEICRIKKELVKLKQLTLLSRPSEQTTI